MRSTFVLIRLAALSALLVVVVSGRAEAVYKATLVGIDYADPPSWERWHVDAEDMWRMMITWGNWDARNIDLLPAGATGPAITAALGGQAVAADDVFLFFYSGHGDWDSDEGHTDEQAPAIDEYDESFWPAGLAHYYDDILTTDLLKPNFDAAASKVVVLDACYSGGLWNGNDQLVPQGDLERVPKTALGASVPEDETSPASSDWARALIRGATKIAGVAPADANGDRAITVKEWFDYAKSIVPKEEVLTHRKTSSKTAVSERSRIDFQALVVCRNDPQIFYGDLDPDLVIFYDPDPIPTMSQWSLFALILLMALVSYAFLRRRRAAQAVMT
jgi:hypothetical protein